MPQAERRCTAPSGTLTCLVGNKLDGMQAESATWGEKEGGGLKGGLALQSQHLFLRTLAAVLCYSQQAGLGSSEDVFERLAI